MERSAARCLIAQSNRFSWGKILSGWRCSGRLSLLDALPVLLLSLWLFFDWPGLSKTHHSGAGTTLGVWRQTPQFVRSVRAGVVSSLPLFDLQFVEGFFAMAEKKMLAYHGNEEFRRRFLDEMRWHQKQDRVIQGTYGNNWDHENFRGCAVGCSINSLNRMLKPESDFHSSDFQIYPLHLGWPAWVASVEELIFENISEDSSPDLFPLELSQSVKAGVDLQRVFFPLMIWVVSRGACRWSSRGLGWELFRCLLNLAQGNEVRLSREIWEASVNHFESRLRGFIELLSKRESVQIDYGAMREVIRSVWLFESDCFISELRCEFIRLISQLEPEK